MQTRSVPAQGLRQAAELVGYTLQTSMTPSKESSKLDHALILRLHHVQTGSNFFLLPLTFERNVGGTIPY